MNDMNSTATHIGTATWVTFNSWGQARKEHWLWSFRRLGGRIVNPPAISGLTQVKPGKFKLNTAATRRGGSAN